MKLFSPKPYLYFKKQSFSEGFEFLNLSEFHTSDVTLLVFACWRTVVPFSQGSDSTLFLKSTKNGNFLEIGNEEKLKFKIWKVILQFGE